MSAGEDTELEGLAIRRWANAGRGAGGPGAGLGVPDTGPLAGRVVFVPGTVPGDVVRARVERVKRRWARAELVAIREPSAARRTPFCPVQERCGGCPWMCGTEAVQARERLAILRGEAEKALGWTPERAAARVELAPDEGPHDRYRIRVRLAWRLRRDGGVELGYRAPRSHEIVDVPGCPVAVEAIEGFLPRLRQALARGAPGSGEGEPGPGEGEPGSGEGEPGSGEGEVDVLAGEEGVAALVRPEAGTPWRLGPEAVTVRCGADRLRARPESFLQANPIVAGRIAAEIEAAARESGARHAVELFAGLGTWTRALRRGGAEVTAYEGSREARAPFETNTADLGGVRLYTGDLLGLGVPLPAPEAPDLVLLDPPRRGARSLMPWARRCGARRVVLVSCEPATAMRDLATLTEDGGWEVSRVVGYDMFPQTGHQELVATARPRSGAPLS